MPLKLAPFGTGPIYTLTGTELGEACIIERLENNAVIRELSDGSGRVSVSNHFQSTLNQEGKGWKSRAVDSQGRADQISRVNYLRFPASNFDWLSYPNVNQLTRPYMLANAKSGSLMAQGWEKHGAVTKIYRH